MKLLGRGLARGIGFGLAVATVGLWLQLIPLMERRFGPGALFMAQTSALEIGLGGLLGLALAPLLRLRGGAALHLAALALAWWGLERWVRLDSPQFGPSRWCDRRAPPCSCCSASSSRAGARGSPGRSAPLLLAGGIAAPGIYLRATTPAAPAPRPSCRPRRPARPTWCWSCSTRCAPGASPATATGGRRRRSSTRSRAKARCSSTRPRPPPGRCPPTPRSSPAAIPRATAPTPSTASSTAAFPTLADVLARNGYETFCLTANPWISDGLGLTRGFAWQDASLREQGGAGLGFSFVHRLLDRLGLQESDKGGGAVAAHFEKWARERPAARDHPAFVFLNFIEAHFPYHQLPHEHLFQFTDGSYGELRSLSVDLVGQQFGGKGRPVAESAGPARDMYDGGVAYSSSLLSRVVEALRARGTLDHTVLVVLADHGEVLGERGGFFGHGPSLYQEAVGVPLLVRYPPRIPGGTRVAEPVSTLGVFATILDLAGVEAPPTLQVGSLVPLAIGAPGATAGPVLSELQALAAMGLGEREASDRTDPQMDGDLRYRLLREGSLKLVVTSKGGHFLYDLASDPRETHDLAAERSGAAGDACRRTSRRWSRNRKLPALDAPLAAGEDAPELDDATKEQLKALGYAE